MLWLALSSRLAYSIDHHHGYILATDIDGACGLFATTPTSYTQGRVTAFMGWSYCIHRMELLHSQDGVTAFTGWSYCVHGVELLRSWGGVTSVTGWSYCIHRVELLHSQGGVTAFTG